VVWQEAPIVSESVAEQSALHSDGLRQKLTTAVGQAKEAFGHARESVKDKAQNLSEQAKVLLEQAKDKAQVLGEQAKDKAQNFTEQAKDKAQALSVQALEGAHDALENVQQKLDSKATEETPTLLEAPVDPPSEFQ
jgi:F0F1-type ATP synthase membrane subunit b/b'